MKLKTQIENYVPANEQEECDRKLMLDLLETQSDLFTRRNKAAHFTASAWVTNQARDKVLMAYHKIYDSWAWLGGHADGEEDLLKVALKEVKEESGLSRVVPVSDDIVSLEVLGVDGHMKKGEYISSHLHLNVTYLLEADDLEELQNKEDENSAVAWFSPSEAIEKSSEPWFQEHIYPKLNKRLEVYREKAREEKFEMKSASDCITEGCMVLEGGAFRGLYTQGVLDYLMEHDVNMQTTIGVSAGAMSGMNYVSGQIHRSFIINMKYRHDRNYIGVGAMRKDHGITGFSYLWNEISELYPLDEERFNDARRRFVAVATDTETGKAAYFEKGKCSDIFAATQASATVPYISEPVEIDDRKYLDGGIAERIPYQWALQEGFDKIVVIRTRDSSYRKTSRPLFRLIEAEYQNMPGIKAGLLEEVPRYNLSIQNLENLEQQGRVFVISPSRPIDISRFEGNLDALEEVYDLGRKDAAMCFEQLLKYLEK